MSDFEFNKAGLNLKQQKRIDELETENEGLKKKEQKFKDDLK